MWSECNISLSQGTGAAGYMTPYTYATLPQAGATTGGFGLSPYQGAAGASLQEARLQ